MDRWDGRTISFWYVWHVVLLIVSNGKSGLRGFKSIAKKVKVKGWKACSESMGSILLEGAMDSIIFNPSHTLAAGLAQRHSGMINLGFDNYWYSI